MSSSGVYLENMTDWAAFLEERYAKRRGLPVSEVRPDLAFSIGVPPSTFKDLKIGRVKTARVHIFEPIRRAFIKELRLEQQRLETMLANALADGEDPSRAEIEQAQQLLEKARSLLRAD